MDKETLRKIYFAIFHTYVICVSTAWKTRTCQNCVTIFKSFAFMNNCFISNSFSVFPERFKLVTKSHARNTR